MTNRRDFIKQSSAIVAGGLLGGNLFSACQMAVSTNPRKGRFRTTGSRSGESVLPNLQFGRIDGN